MEHIREKLTAVRQQRSAKRRQLIHANVDWGLSREISTVLFDPVCKSVDVAWYCAKALVREAVAQRLLKE